VADGIAELRRLVEAEEYDLSETPGTLTERDILSEYIEDLKSRFNIEKKLKVVVDPSAATPGLIVPRALEALGFEVICHNCVVDPTFPLGTPDPTTEHVAERLSTEVIAAGADIGFSYDVDGDRIGIVDETGRIIWNDVLLALFSMDVLYDHPGATIMFNTLCSNVVPETIARSGGVPFMWRTGHSFLKKKNQEVGAAFIGELSGHFFFAADFYNHDDGVYSTLKLLDYLSRTGLKLSEAIAQLKLYKSSPEIKLYCADAVKVSVVARLATIVRQDWPEATVIDDERAGDGLRLDMDNGMFVIRYSQNGPYLTIKFEGIDESAYNEFKSYLNKLLHEVPEIDWDNLMNVNHNALN
jgi:phosphomannomutase/phosphoglucomutase